MELAELASITLTYTTLEALDYGGGGQLYGTMEGSLAGDRLNGMLRLTNLAPRRPDGVNLPAPPPRRWTRRGRRPGPRARPGARPGHGGAGVDVTVVGEQRDEDDADAGEQGRSHARTLRFTAAAGPGLRRSRGRAGDRRRRLGAGHHCGRR